MLLSQVLLLGFIYYGAGEDIIWNKKEKSRAYNEGITEIICKGEVLV